MPWYGILPVYEDTKLQSNTSGSTHERASGMTIIIDVNNKKHIEWVKNTFYIFLKFV